MVALFHFLIFGSLFFCNCHSEDPAKCGYQSVVKEQSLRFVEGSLELPEACDWEFPFQCITVHNRKCISAENFCDLVADCLDGSDEADCRPKDYGDFYPYFGGKSEVFPLLTYAYKGFTKLDVHQYLAAAPVDENYNFGKPKWSELQDHQISPFINYTFRNLVPLHKAFYDQPGVLAAYMISLSKANGVKGPYLYEEYSDVVLMTRYLNEAINRLIFKVEKYQVPYYM